MYYKDRNHESRFHRLWQMAGCRDDLVTPIYVLSSLEQDLDKFVSRHGIDASWLVNYSDKDEWSLQEQKLVRLAASFCDHRQYQYSVDTVLKGLSDENRRVAITGMELHYQD